MVLQRRKRYVNQNHGGCNYSGGSRERQEEAEGGRVRQREEEEAGV